MNDAAPATPEKLTPRHGFLVLLLSLVVMIEGFDIAASSVVLPYLGKEFGAPPAALGNALAFIAAGSTGSIPATCTLLKAIAGLAAPSIS